MARIRYLKPEFFEDEDIASLTFQERLFYAGLWCHADKAGRLEDRPKRLKAVIFPYDQIDAEKILSRLCQDKSSGRPFIQRYEVDGDKFIQIIQWEKHQSPHHTEKESKFPPAPPFKEKDKDKEKDKCSSPLPPLRNGELTVKEPLKDVLTLGEFKNIRLTYQEYSTLIERYSKSTVDSKIESFSSNLKSQPKKYGKYKSHYATIGNWLRNDGHKPKAKAEINKTFPKCPQCQKETTQADLDKLGSCPGCFKPLPTEKLKELIGNIGKPIT